MAADKHMILGVHITNRLKKATEVQKLFTKYGCYIKTRLGLHEVSPDFCSSTGIVLLELTGDPKMCKEFAAGLKAVEGVDVKQMIFTHD